VHDGPHPLLASLLAAAAITLLPGARAEAQALETCDAIEAPEELARLGAELAQSGAWDSAAICFERLAARAPDDAARGDARFNLGIALQSLGRHREARDVFSSWMRDHGATSDDATRAEAARLFATEGARVATLELELPAGVAELEVRVDGRPVPVTARPLPVELDPGAHNVTVSADGHVAFTWDGRLADGGHETVTVTLVPIESVAITDSPAFWVGMALIAVAIAGGVVLGVVLQDDAQLDARAGLEVIRL
jgi:hypothetical protein